ncbi:MAG: FAD-binding protein, partial [Synergistaceae bacterium]|nr:FAD-binding protein [Synergistaceae bacterium]
MSENLTKFFNGIRERCPNTRILTDEEDRLIYSHGCYPREYKWMLQGKYPHVTDGVLVPSDAGEISRILVLANEISVSVIPFGGGSGIVGGTIPYSGQVIIDTKRLTDFSVNAVNMTAR